LPSRRKYSAPRLRGEHEYRRPKRYASRGKPRAITGDRAIELAQLLALRAWCRRELSDKRLGARFGVHPNTIGNYRDRVPRESIVRPQLTAAELEALARSLSRIGETDHAPIP
jgi:hypothetical protein